MSDYIDIDDANKPSDWYMDLDIKYDDREAAKAISPLGLGWDNPNRTWYLRSGYANDLPALLDLIQEKKLSPTKKSPDNKPASGSSTKSNGQLVAKVKSWNTVKATDKTVQRMITKIAQEIFEQDPTFTVQMGIINSEAGTAFNEYVTALATTLINEFFGSPNEADAEAKFIAFFVAAIPSRVQKMQQEKKSPSKLVDLTDDNFKDNKTRDLKRKHTEEMEIANLEIQQMQELMQQKQRLAQVKAEFEKVMSGTSPSKTLFPSSFSSPTSSSSSSSSNSPFTDQVLEIERAHQLLNSQNFTILDEVKHLPGGSSSKLADDEEPERKIDESSQPATTTSTVTISTTSTSTTSTSSTSTQKRGRK